MARTDNFWQVASTGYIKPMDGADAMSILLSGSNKYINFNTLTGSSGYGIRDNAGVMEFKNSGGVWTGIGTGGGGSTAYNMTLEFMSGILTYSFYSPYAMTIDTVTNILNAPTTTITVAGSAYTLGTAITQGAVIAVTVSTASVIRLNATK